MNLGSAWFVFMGGILWSMIPPLKLGSNGTPYIWPFISQFRSPIDDSDLDIFNICALHEDLQSLGFTAMPQAIHARLDLNATGRPFWPHEYSDSPAKPLHGEVRKAVLDKLLEFERKLFQQIDLPTSSEDQSEHELNIHIRVAYILLNDARRNTYARRFLPIFKGRKHDETDTANEARRRLVVMAKICGRVGIDFERFIMELSSF